MPGHCLSYENTDEVAAKREKMVEYIIEAVKNATYSDLKKISMLISVIINY